MRTVESPRTKVLKNHWEIISTGALNIVSKQYNDLRIDIILGKERTPRYVKARREAILLMFSMGLSNFRIAKIFGRHHTSIMEYTNPEMRIKKRITSAQRWAKSRYYSHPFGESSTL